MTLPANIRINANVPFPSMVQGSGPIGVGKANGIWTISFAVTAFGIQNPPPLANWATDNALVYDSAAKQFVQVPLASLPTTTMLYRIATRGVNFNSGNTDTQIPIVLPTGISRYFVWAVDISNASHSLSTATFGLFTAAAAGGIAIIAGGTAITVTATAADTNNNAQRVTTTNQVTQAYNDATLFFRVGTAEGAAATADVILEIVPLS